jgi:alkylation response protein AidB-like acyl-CoA dehydrogenase
MRFSFSDDQRAFADGLREMLDRECPLSVVRGVWDDGSGHSPALWARLDEMGVLTMLVPEADGGMGGSMVDAILLLQELGRAGVPGPVIEHMVAARWMGTEAPATTWVDGEPYVAHAAVAGAILTPTGVLRDYDVAAVDGVDGGRTLARVSGGTVTPADVPTDAVRDELTVATASFLIGLGERMIDIAGEYARQREQFGKPIGAFQAVKHLLANALLEIEFAKAPTYRAAWSVSTGAATVERDVSMAKVMANEAAYRAGRAAMQVHGGIGYTWEADLQLLMKKAWALSRAHGATRAHRQRVAAAVLDRR